MDPLLKPFYELLQVDERLMIGCLEGVDEATARRRLSDRSPNIASVAAQAVEARYALAEFLGIEASNPLRARLEGLRRLEEFTELPLLEEVLAAWLAVSRPLAERFAKLSAAELRAPSPRAFPIGDPSLLGGLAYLIQRESHLLGQLGLLRRCFIEE